jgi:hypothetical protein
LITDSRSLCKSDWPFKVPGSKFEVFGRIGSGLSDLEL